MVDAYLTLTGMDAAKKSEQTVQPVVQVIQNVPAQQPGHHQHQRNQRFSNQMQAAVNNAMAA
jgi:hypothetical protein